MSGIWSLTNRVSPVFDDTVYTSALTAAPNICAIVTNDSGTNLASLQSQSFNMRRVSAGPTSTGNVIMSSFTTIKTDTDLIKQNHSIVNINDLSQESHGNVTMYALMPSDCVNFKSTNFSPCQCSTSSVTFVPKIITRLPYVENHVTNGNQYGLFATVKEEKYSNQCSQCVVYIKHHSTALQLGDSTIPSTEHNYVHRCASGNEIDTAEHAQCVYKNECPQDIDNYNTNAFRFTSTNISSTSLAPDVENKTLPSVNLTAADSTLTSEPSPSTGRVLRNLRTRSNRNFMPAKVRYKRETIQGMTRQLKRWLLSHKDNPYPSKSEKMDLVSESKMSVIQVSNWFANARRRLKKTVNQDVSWARRINLYNRCIHGNAELLSNCSETSLYDDITNKCRCQSSPDELNENFVFHSNNDNGDKDEDYFLNEDDTDTDNSVPQKKFLISESSTTGSLRSNKSTLPSTSPGSARPSPSLPEETCHSFQKFKHAILQRYLNDAHQHAIFIDEKSKENSRLPRYSSSSGSHYSEPTLPFTPPPDNKTENCKKSCDKAIIDVLEYMDDTKSCLATDCSEDGDSQTYGDEDFVGAAQNAEVIT